MTNDVSDLKLLADNFADLRLANEMTDFELPANDITDSNVQYNEEEVSEGADMWLSLLPLTSKCTSTESPLKHDLLTDSFLYSKTGNRYSYHIDH